MISQREAESILRPHLQRIYKSVAAGWSQYEEMRKQFPFLDKTARANFVHDGMIAAARERFEGVETVTVVPHFQSWFVNFDHRLYMRLKKFDSALRPDNVPTRILREMLGQNRLPGHGPSATYLIAGYRLNAAETAIEGVHITCPLEKRNAWSFQIADDGSIAEVVEIRPLFDEPGEIVIRPKRGRGRKGEDESSG